MHAYGMVCMVARVFPFKHGFERHGRLPSLLARRRTRGLARGLRQPNQEMAMSQLTLFKDVYTVGNPGNSVSVAQ